MTTSDIKTLDRIEEIHNELDEQADVASDRLAAGFELEIELIIEGAMKLASDEIAWEEIVMLTFKKISGGM